MLVQRLREGVKDLAPGYFGLPMATGVIALASQALGHTTVGKLLFVVNHAEYGVLCVLFALRLLFQRSALVADLSDHAKGAGFLTLVAATCLLGMQHLHFAQDHRAAAVLWYVALLAWAVLAYAFFILVSIRKHKPRLQQGINGSWLLMVVAVQALSILACANAGYMGLPLREALFTAMLFHLLGWIFYLILIGIIFFRTAFAPLRPDGFEPSYWINMGAAAITTLAASMLTSAFQSSSPWPGLVPMFKLLAASAWVAGIWWIPIVFIVGLWKHRYMPLRYQSGYWSLVFPLGMYTLCTWHLGRLFDVPIVHQVPHYFIWLAWGAWGAAYVGMAKHVVRSLSPPPASALRS